MRTLIVSVCAVLLLVSCSGVKVSETNMGRCSDLDFSECMVAAEQGDAAAQFNLGVMYDNGEGVALDDKKAVYWYSKAAKQGFADAQNNLGWMYDNGEGVALDDKKAVYWYKKAAAQGNPESKKELKELKKRAITSPRSKRGNPEVQKELKPSKKRERVLPNSRESKGKSNQSGDRLLASFGDKLDRLLSIFRVKFDIWRIIGEIWVLGGICTIVFIIVGSDEDEGDAPFYIILLFAVPIMFAWPWFFNEFRKDKSLPLWPFS